MTPRRWTIVAILAGFLAIATALSPAAPRSLGAVHPDRRYFLVKLPNLEVELTVAGRHIYRGGVSAPAFCPDGPAPQGLGFGIVGGRGLPIRGRQNRFDKSTLGSTRKEIFRGRVESDRIVGVFFSNYREEPTGERGLPEEPFGPHCGNGTPHGEVVHFVAPEVPEGKIASQYR
jgi:hypothetical protein